MPRPIHDWNTLAARAGRMRCLALLAAGMALEAATASAAPTELAQACRQAAGFDEKNHWVRPPTAQAVVLCERAAAEPGALADVQAYLGRAYYLDKQPAKARASIERAHAEGSLTGMALLGVLSNFGYDTPKDPVQAVAWYRKAAEAGHASAQGNLGRSYENGDGVDKANAMAIRWYHSAAAQGLASTQTDLGRMYEHGHGVDKDEAQAVAWYRKAADQGNADAQRRLGLMYWDGRGVDKDATQAIAWTRKAAEQGIPAAQHSLGATYEHGWGVNKDEGQAVGWFRKAAEQGIADSQSSLGTMYADGRGVERDQAQALVWYRKAAEQGDARARAALGNFYARGHAGTAPDQQAAQAWWSLAAQDAPESEAGQGAALSLLQRQPVASALAQLEALRQREPERGLQLHVDYLVRAELVSLAIQQVEAYMQSARFASLAPQRKEQALASLRAILTRICREEFRGETDLELLERLFALGVPEAARLLGVALFRRNQPGDMKMATEWYRRAAEHGDAMAQAEFGRMLIQGRGIAKDEAQAAAWTRRSAEQGLAAAQHNLGLMYAGGWGIAADHGEAAAWYRKAAEQGYTDAQYRLANLYLQGQGVEKDAVQAVAWFRKAAEEGHAQAQWRLGVAYERAEGVERDMPQAIAWLRMAAESGNADAQRRLGLILNLGLGGIAFDQAAASAWYRKAADQGDSLGQAFLGGMYQYGQGVPQDHVQAADLYRRSAEQGDGHGQYLLGKMLEHGWGVSKDPVQAATWYHKSADQGDAEAQSALGWLYESGQGVAQDDGQAVSLYRQAAQAGNALAMVRLAERHRHGRGMPKDQAQAEQLRAKVATLTAYPQFELAEALWEGAGLPQDRARAISLYKSSATLGNFRADGRLRALLGDAFARVGMESTSSARTSPAAQSRHAAATARPLAPPSRSATAALQRQVGQEVAVLAQEAEQLAGQHRWRDAAVATARIADWHAAAGEMPQAVAAQLRSRVLHDIGSATYFGSEDNYFHLLQSSCLWSQAARWARGIGQPEAALFMAKFAVNRLQQARRQLHQLDDSLKECFLKVHEDRYRWLADLMVDLGQLAEAEQVLTMLKHFEVEEYVRRSDAPHASAQHEFAYGRGERTLLQHVQALQQQALAAAGLRRLNEVARQRALSPEETQERDGARQQLALAEQQLQEGMQVLLEDLRNLGQAGGSPSKREAEVQAAASIQGTLHRVFKGQAAVVQSVVLQDRMHLLVTTADTQQVVQVQIARSELARKVAAFRQAVQDRSQDPRVRGRELYQLLIAPVEPLLGKAGISTLMLSADDVLRYVPFAALHDGERYLVERYALSAYNPATRDMLVAPVQKTDWRVAAFGVSEAQPALRFEALPDVPAELRAVVREQGESTGVLPGVRRLDRHFTRAEFSDALSLGYPAVHVASHFRLKFGDRQQSMLLFGQGDTVALADLAKRNLGNLSFNFRDVDLLTLSACETAVPVGEDKATGAEVESFSTLMHQAGARSVLATLWPVADRATAQFMQRFYGYLTQPQVPNKAEALRQAQLDFIRGQSAAPADTSERGVRVASTAATGTAQPAAGLAHPYFWAPFSLLGNWL